LARPEKISPSWQGEPCIVAATGPSLTPEVAQTCRMARWLRQWRVIAVQDAYRLMPWADALYGCDPRWWKVHKDCDGFKGEKWSTHVDNDADNKTAESEAYGIRLVRGQDSSEFSFDPSVISYGQNSGFQAINLALLKGCRRIVLVGFDMQSVKGQAHFFGDHPPRLNGRTDYQIFIPRFEWAAKHLPKDVRIVNATPDSALRCFKMRTLEDALADDSVRGDRPEPDCRASAGSAG
jgi:hypothetical protein